MSNFYHEWRDCASSVHRKHLLPTAYPKAVLELTSCLMCFTTPCKTLEAYLSSDEEGLAYVASWSWLGDTTLLSCSRKTWVSLDFYIFYWLFFLFNTLILSLFPQLYQYFQLHFLFQAGSGLCIFMAVSEITLIFQKPEPRSAQRHWIDAKPCISAEPLGRS